MDNSEKQLLKVDSAREPNPVATSSGVRSSLKIRVDYYYTLSVWDQLYILQKKSCCGPIPSKTEESNGER